MRSYHDHPGLIDAFAARVGEGLSRWPEEERDRVHVVFSAHSLPERVLADGDPYDAQCRETARLVDERAGLPLERWSWSYQSAGRTPEPWAGPDLGDHLEELAERVRDTDPGAAEALVDWEGAEIARERAFAVIRNRHARDESFEKMRDFHIAHSIFRGVA